MRIERCYFCSGPVYPGHGAMFVRNDCKTFRFCRPKCHRHFKAKHNPRKFAWTKAARKLNNKELTNDTIFEFEKKRNEPLQYNRDLYVQTVQAMQRIADIKKRREDRFWENRMKLANVQKQQDIEREVLVHGELLSDKNKKEELVQRIREREAVRQE